MAVALGGTDLVNSVVICHPGAFPDRQLKALKVVPFCPSLRSPMLTDVGPSFLGLC